MGRDSRVRLIIHLENRFIRFSFRLKKLINFIPDLPKYFLLGRLSFFQM